MKRAVGWRVAGLLVAPLLAVPPAQSQPTDLAGRTTLEITVTGGDPATGFQTPTAGPGEPHTVREDGVGVAQPGREDRRVSVVHLAQVSDFQLSDEESPARVETIDAVQQAPFPVVAGGGHRPQEAMVPHVVDAMVRQFNQVAVSPVEAGDGSRRPIDFVALTGDLIDNQHRNELVQMLQVLRGGSVDPNSGSSDLADYGVVCLGAELEDEPRYTGVQDYDDYPVGLISDRFWDPDEPLGVWADFPLYPGLMDRAQQPFEAEGFDAPFYVVFGNHDALSQGSQGTIAPFEGVATGCVKLFGPVSTVEDPATSLGDLVPHIDPTTASAALVAPDPVRQYLDKAQYIGLHLDGGAADGHGFGLRDPAEVEGSAGAGGYYSFEPAPEIRVIVLDTVAEGGVLALSAEGNLDDPQFRWLQAELERAAADGVLVIVTGHHPISSLNADFPDELIPCTVDDEHGHDVNPGCDRDPRPSTPVHLGAEVAALFLEFPNVIAYVAGHTHQNRVTPFARSAGGPAGGFWGIESPSLLDWPHHGRLIEVFDNGDGTLSIFGTVIDHLSPVVPPASGTAAGEFSPSELASIARTIACNDPQGGCLTGNGEPIDRNVELLVADPRAAAPASGSNGGESTGGGETLPRTGGGLPVAVVVLAGLALATTAVASAALRKSRAR